jgi:pimeloyl-ACP methyl ester carboxylesterase
MAKEINCDRRRFLGAAIMAFAAAKPVLAGSADARFETGSQAQPITRAEAKVSFRSLKQIHAGVLNVGYAEDGPAGGPAVILLHGWPYDIYTYADVAPVLASAGYRVIIPYLRGYGTTRFLSTDTLRNGQQAALAADVIALMDALEIDQAIVAGCDWGARTANIVAAAWPERCKALVSVSGYLIGSRETNRKPLPPQAELQWWYQFYFATERGRAGYDAHRREFARLIWQIASPTWKFDDATFDRTAASLENPDHVGIVIHNYRWRLGLAEGEPAYDSLENRLAGGPLISVPTITLEGDANGAPHPAPAAYAAKFSGKYVHRNLTGGIGHNLPQEAPKAFAAAVIDVAAL